MRQNEDARANRPPFAQWDPAEVMSRFDRNKDGVMDKEELRLLLQQLVGRMRSGGMTANGPGNAQMRMQVIRRFDEDGDGRLNEEESAAARKAMAGQGFPGGRFRPPGSDAASRESGRKNRISPELLEKFDRDGDGELNAEERKAARTAARAE